MAEEEGEEEEVSLGLLLVPSSYIEGGHPSTRGSERIETTSPRLGTEFAFAF